MLRAAVFLTFASAVAVLFSIAAGQILLALALVALLLSGASLRLPPVWLPLGILLLLTLVSLAASPDPAGGLPQVRKFFVLTVLLVAFSLLRDITLIRRLALCWAAAGAVGALRALVQFGARVSEASALGKGFYEHYVGQRITGFLGHWMTFSGVLMLVLLFLAAFLLFSPARSKGFGLWMLCGVLMSAALILGFTRSIWLATAVGALYLAWFRKRWLVAAVPLVALLALLLAPDSLRHRALSIIRPDLRLDSNVHRIVTWRTGLRMVAAHPWLGLGPEQVKVQFQKFVPDDAPRPLPVGWYGHLHNIYLHYAAERGIPATLALVWALLKMLYDFTRALKSLPAGPGDRRFVLHGSVAAVLAIMTGGLFELNLGDSEVLTVFLVIASCGYVAAAQEPEHV